MDIEVDNPLSTIESFNKQFQIGEKEREAVKSGGEQEMGKTMFSSITSFSRAGNISSLSSPRRTSSLGVLVSKIGFINYPPWMAGVGLAHHFTGGTYRRTVL